MWKREWTWLKLKDKADTHKWHQWWHCRPNADSIRRGISNGTAGRTQTAIAEPGWKRVPTSECVTARAAKGSSRDKHNEPATLSGSGGPRFLIGVHIVKLLENPARLAVPTEKLLPWCIWLLPEPSGGILKTHVTESRHTREGDNLRGYGGQPAKFPFCSMDQCSTRQWTSRGASSPHGVARESRAGAYSRHNMEIRLGRQVQRRWVSSLEFLFIPSSLRLRVRILSAPWISTVFQSVPFLDSWGWWQLDVAFITS